MYNEVTMKKRKLWVSVIAGLMAAMIVFGLVAGAVSTYASAASSGAIKEQLDALKEDKEKIQAEIQALEGQLSQNMGEMEQVVAQKNVIDQEVFLLHEQVKNINEQISAYSTLIADKQDELVEAETKLSDLNVKNKDRIRAMEENGALSYWSVLFQANSFSDLLDRLNMVQEIAAADNKRMQEMNQAAKAVADAKAELETEKTALETSRTELAETEKTLAQKRADADALLVELVAKGQEFEDLLALSEDEEAKLLLDIAAKEKEYDKAKHEEWLATSVPTPTYKPSTSIPSSSGWITPCSYVAFTSPFGYRYHPLSGNWKMHYGVDLAGPQGTPIYAAKSGRVAIASYNGSAGYHVEIIHEGGWASVYMHMTHYVVSKGDYVSQGQLIGYMGSTGGSTGPHLHFGISYNGTYVNPADYINI